MKTEQKEKYLKILNKCVADDDIRPWISEIFVGVDKVCSTNAKILVFCPLFDKEKYQDQTDKVKELYQKERNTNFEIHINKLKEAISYAPLIDETIEETKVTKCKACDGKGEVEWEFYHDGYHYKDGDCPICDGEGEIEQEVETPTGKKIKNPMSKIKIVNTPFSLKYVSLLIEFAEILGVESIFLTREESPNNVSIFKIEEIEVLVMPIICNDESELIYKI